MGKRRWPLRRGVIVALLAGVLLLPGPARADQYTYCVGGYSTANLFFTRQACDSPAERANHGMRWHFHCYVSDGNRCYACWDQQDSTCETGFLVEPQWASMFHKADRAECDRIGAAPDDLIFHRVEDGVVVKTPQPPPRTQTTIKTEIVRLSPGPYASGDSVTVVARATDGNGAPRPATGGEVVLTKADGSTQKVAATPNADGTFTATFQLPAGGDVGLALTATGVTLGAQEDLAGAIGGASSRLTVSPCRLRARLTSAHDGDVVIGGAPYALTGELVDASGKKIGSGSLGGATLHFALETNGGTHLDDEATIDTDGLVHATLKPPVPGGDDEGQVTLSARGGPGDICPGPAAKVHLSALGVAVDFTRAPTRCYVGMPCAVDLSLRMPSDPKVQGQASGFVHAPDLQATLEVNGEKAATLTRGPGDTLSGSFTPSAPGDFTVAADVRAAGKDVSGQQRISIRWPLKLLAANALDLGTHPAGSPWKPTCVPLSLAGSIGAEEQKLRLTAEMPPGCRGALLFNDDGVGVPLLRDAGASGTAGVEVEAGQKLAIPICLRAPDCGIGEAPQGVLLHLAAVDPMFKDQAAQVQVTYRVTGRNWVSCYGFWLWVLGASLLTGFITRGFIVPFDFSADDVLRVASKEAALARAVARPFREMPSGKSGWYRSARFGLRGDGSPTDRLSSAIVVFMARRNDVLVMSRGATLRRLNARTRALEPVSDPASHSVIRNAIYEVNGLYFKVG